MNNGDTKYFLDFFRSKGYEDEDTRAFLKLFTQCFQIKLLEQGSVTLHNIGKFGAEVIPAHVSTKFGGKYFPENIRIRYTPSRKGILKVWKNKYSSEAKQQQALDKLKENLLK
jgi:hypothetical protein